ncbi:shikimate kinase [Pueribacillus sp. YX66]|uniref:shikimate kinase n=1 Tax=Pueribacillus sp. YX66 TaxID=3229242 RepID=UPI00358D8F7B
MNAIYITGFMGAGKTTVGKVLSEKTGLPVYDSDEFIVEQEKRSIEEIFKVEGEVYFREAESRALQSLPTKNAIITTGGGIILKKENRKFMKKNGTVLFLYCRPDVVFERLREDDSRPLLAGNKMKEINSLLQARLPLYKEADYTIDTSSLTIDETVQKIITIVTKNGTN